MTRTTSTTPSGPGPTLAATPDRALIRAAGGSVRYLRLRVIAPADVSRTARPPLEIAFALDRSGSMAGTKLELAKHAVDVGLGRLEPGDQFAIVTFDNEVDVLMPRTPVQGGGVMLARYALAPIEARGSTALCEGWLTACGAIAAAAIPGAITRCLLLTDGQANIGEAAPEALAHHARELQKRGVRTSTFGLGADFNEQLLEGLATAGGGNFYFIEHPNQLPDVFSSELGEALEITARNVRLVLHAPGVAIDPLVGYEVEALGDMRTLKLNDLTSGQVLDLVVAMTFPRGNPGEHREVGVQLHVGPDDPGDTLQGALAFAGPAAETTVRFTFADHANNDGQPRAVEVDRLVAKAYAARARKAAVHANRQGNYDAAERTMLATARRIASYAKGDAELMALVTELAAEAARHRHALSEMTRKELYARSTHTLKGRDSSGKASRRS